MASNAAFAEVANLAGDPARAGMLHALMDGRALTATELARVAGITPQTASGHLARLTAGGLVTVEKQGRHRYHRLASSPLRACWKASCRSPLLRRTAQKGLRRSARSGVARRAHLLRSSRRSSWRRACRCAGGARPDRTDRRCRHRHRERRGACSIASASISTQTLARKDRGKRKGRMLCRPCLDWSERRPHLAGVVGAALCKHCLTEGWIKHVDGTRAVAVTVKGQRNFREIFRIDAPTN